MTDEFPVSFLTWVIKAWPRVSSSYCRSLQSQIAHINSNHSKAFAPAAEDCHIWSSLYALFSSYCIWKADTYYKKKHQIRVKLGEWEEAHPLRFTLPLIALLVKLNSDKILNLPLRHIVKGWGGHGGVRPGNKSACSPFPSLPEEPLALPLAVQRRLGKRVW